MSGSGERGTRVPRVDVARFGEWGTHLSAGQGAPGHCKCAIQLSGVIVLQRRVQLVPGGPRAGGSGRGTRGRGPCWSDFRVGSPSGGVRGGRRLLLLLQLPESAEGHGSGAPRRRRQLCETGLAVARGCQPGGWRRVASLYRIVELGGPGRARGERPPGGPAPKATGPTPPEGVLPAAPPTTPNTQPGWGKSQGPSAPGRKNLAAEEASLGGAGRGGGRGVSVIPGEAGFRVADGVCEGACAQDLEFW